MLADEREEGVVIPVGCFCVFLEISDLLNIYENTTGRTKNGKRYSLEGEMGMGVGKARVLFGLWKAEHLNWPTAPAMFGRV